MAQAFVIGDVARDETLHLAVLPAPSASVHGQRGAAGPGGRGLNQSVTLACAGVATIFVARVDGDTGVRSIGVALVAERLA